MAGIIDLFANMAMTGVGTVAGFQVSLRAAQNVQPHPMPHQFAALLEHPMRVQYLDPAEVLGMYGISAEMTVLDLGCGTGLFTRPAAHMVGERGRVHAVDAQRAMLAATERGAHAEGISSRITLHHAGAYELPLPDDSVDLAILVSTIGEFPDKPAALSELRRVLKGGARLGISEELLNPAYVLAGSVRRWAEEAGFFFVAKTGSPFCYHMAFANAK